MTTSLVVRGISASYGPTPVLGGIDLDVPAGTTTAILGPSGCGKTTLLRVVAGFHSPTAGEVRLGDRVVVGPGVEVPPGEARHRLRRPGGSPVPPPVRRRQHRLRARPPRSALTGPGRGAARARRAPGGGRRAAAGPALRRAAAASGAGAVTRPPALARAARRALLVAGRGAARVDASGRGGCAGRGGGDRAAGDPRPGRGALLRRPGRDHARRGLRAGRLAGAGLRRAGGPGVRGLPRRPDRGVR